MKRTAASRTAAAWKLILLQQTLKVAPGQAMALICSWIKLDVETIIRFVGW